MASKGGARPGAGRKTKAEEDKVRLLAEAAIKRKYGSIEKGFQALLSSGSDMLVKFVFEHAFGKPKEKVELSNKEGEGFSVTLNINPT